MLATALSASWLLYLSVNLKSDAQRHSELQRATTSSDTDLHVWLGREAPIDPYVLATIASLPQSSAETLDRIAHLDDPRLFHRMGSLDPLLMEHNPHGLAVMRLVARHPNVFSTTLAHLAKTTVDYVAGDVANSWRRP